MVVVAEGLMPAAADAEGVPWVRLGTTGGELLVVTGGDLLADGGSGQPLVLDVAELGERSQAALPALF